MALTGVPPLDASLSHSIKRGPYEGSERDFPGGGAKLGEGKARQGVSLTDVGLVDQWVSF
jgi:hypothetical protein